MGVNRPVGALMDKNEAYSSNGLVSTVKSLLRIKYDRYRSDQRFLGD